jgi:integrase/recombinase XerD
MGLGKQAKTLSKKQVDNVSKMLRLNSRNGLRNQTIFLLSVKSGLRAKEIAHLTWKMVLTSDGDVDDVINLTNASSKGNSGRTIPIHKEVKENLISLMDVQKRRRDWDVDNTVVRTERSTSTSPQAIVNMFGGWYKELGLVGCSSHSGRRTFITETSKKISLVGGSLRDVQMLVGHSSLQTTQRYIEGDSLSRKKVVNLL